MTLSSDQIKAERALFEAEFAPLHDLWLEIDQVAPQRYMDQQTEVAFAAWIAAKSTPVLVTPERIIAVAKLLMALDEGCKVSDWQPGLDNIFAATVHGGDCTKECHTCPVCQAGEYKDRVRQIAAALNPGGE